MKLTTLTAAITLMATSVFGQGIKLAHDGPPDMEQFGSYVWGHTFATYLNDHGMAVEEFQRGALGGEAERLDQVSQGLLQVSMSAVKAAGSLDKLVYGVYLPYLFTSTEQLDSALYENGMLARINEGTTPKGVRVLGFYHLGLPAGVFNTKHPVATVDDMSDLRLRALDEFQISLFDAWGASGTIISWPEVTNALQTGVADGYVGPPLMPLIFGQTEILSDYTDARVAMSVRVAIASEDWYQGLSDEERATVGAAVDAANAANREWVGKREGILQALAGAGVTVTTPTPEALAEFSARAHSVYADGPMNADQVAEWLAAAGQ